MAYSIQVRETGRLVVMWCSKASLQRKGGYRYLFTGKNRGVYTLVPEGENHV